MWDGLAAQEEGPTRQAGDLSGYPGRKEATDKHEMSEGAMGWKRRS